MTEGSQIADLRVRVASVASGARMGRPGIRDWCWTRSTRLPTVGGLAQIVSDGRRSWGRSVSPRTCGC